MIHFAQGAVDRSISETEAGTLIDGMLESLGTLRRVLIIPPDFTRAHSWAGDLTGLLYHRLKDQSHVEILPALGTHAPMTREETTRMFPGVPYESFKVHDWRKALVRLGEVPASFVSEVTKGCADFPIPCEINESLVAGDWDAIISVGQVVPHEVIGMANHNKNIFVGVGGADTINKSHYIGAICNMERVMGRETSPVRDVFNYMSKHFAQDLPIHYLLTVRAKNECGELVTRGLYAGDSDACFLKAAALAQQVNLDLLEASLEKVVVYLDPTEFKSTWLGNKAIYRTRMAMADNGELIILGPGVREFGEDAEIDRLIRKYGYHGTPQTLRLVAENEDLASNLGAAAHLIHGSSEGRFRITYCPGHLTREEIEGAGFTWGDLSAMLEKYSPENLKDGFNTLPDGERIFYVSNPALGLWGLKAQFDAHKGQ